LTATGEGPPEEWYRHRRSASDTVYLYLKDRILRGDLKPGETLVIKEVTDTLGISVTPVREVMHRLAAEGLVERSPFKRVCVARLSTKDLHHLYEVRLPLERLAVANVAKSIELRDLEALEALVTNVEAVAAAGDAVGRIKWAREFHQAIYMQLDNPYLRQMLLSLRDKSGRYITILRATFSLPAASAGTHRAILEAIRRQDGAAAAAAVEEDLSETVKAMDRYVGEEGVVSVE
jgi:DNA-binding GntR family transcriptional regulator